MSKLIYRQNNLFCIDKNKLSEKANKTPIVNSLYAALYEEFKGAAINPRYKKLTPKEKMDKVNEFAHNWLKERGLL